MNLFYLTLLSSYEGTDHEEGSVEEERQQLQEIISDVVVAFLQAQDARGEEGFVLIQGHHVDTVPGEESKLGQVLHHHHHLQADPVRRR